MYYYVWIYRLAACESVYLIGRRLGSLLLLLLLLLLLTAQQK
jgi:hypothetical protein